MYVTSTNVIKSTEPDEITNVTRVSRLKYGFFWQYFKLLQRIKRFDIIYIYIYTLNKRKSELPAQVDNNMLTNMLKSYKETMHGKDKSK